MNNREDTTIQSPLAGDISAPVKDNYLTTNAGIIIGFLIILFTEVGLVILAILLLTHLQTKLLVSLVNVPVLISLAFVPYKIRIRVDKLNQSVTFRRYAIIPGVWNCKDRTYRLDLIKEFTIAKMRILGKRYFTIYINFNSGAPQEAVITGQDTSCSFDFSPELDNIPVMINNWIRM